MANTTIKFNCESGDGSTVEAELNNHLDTHTSICLTTTCTYGELSSVILDVSTAIKFAKRIRTLINEAKEVDNV